MSAVIVAGSGRSGTTWVAEMLAAMGASRIVFEPFHSRVPIGKLFAFRYFRAGDDCPPLAAFWDLCLQGKVASKWVHHIQRGRPNPGPGTVVKAIRANLMLAWVRELYPAVPVVYLVRDPRAVVASQVRRQWKPQVALASILQQPTLLGDHLTPELLDRVRSFDNDATGQAVLWSIENRVVARQATQAGIRVLAYEDLLDGPESALPVLAAAAGFDEWQAAVPSFYKPSKTAYWEGGPQSTMARLNRWKVDLCGKDIRRITETVTAFGLEDLMRED